MNNWGETSDIPMFTSRIGCVARNVVFDKEDSNRFKIRSDSGADFGFAVQGTAESGHYYSLVKSSDSADIVVAPGTYDIWYRPDMCWVFVMEPGVFPNNATYAEPK